MGLIFANPLGLLGLLAIPAIVLIHFFQRESRRVEITTLFLLEKRTEDTRSGRQFVRLRQSLPMWLQILAAILFTWLLVQPRWLRTDSQQRVVFLVDSSLSMAAFEPELTSKVRTLATDYGRAAAVTEFILLETDPSAAARYRGTDSGGLMTALDAWTPSLGDHDVGQAIRGAKAVAGEAGTLVFLSDRPVEDVGVGVRTVGIGKPIENWGFVGVRVEERSDQLVWRAVLRNYGSAAGTRNWWFEADEVRSPPTEVTLEPGQTIVVNGPFPDGKDRFEIVLGEDEFLLDNRVPLVKPVAKSLIAGIAAPPGGEGASEQDQRRTFAGLFGRFATSIPATLPGTVDAADILFTAVETLPPITSETGRADAPAGAGAIGTAGETDAATSGNPTNVAAQPADRRGNRDRIIFFNSGDGDTDAKLATDLIASEPSPYVEGITFNGLLVRGRGGLLESADRFTPLVWQGGRPIIFLRQRSDGRDLVFDFDPRFSNLDRLPAFVVLLNRFAEETREQKPAFHADNVELRQVLELPGIDIEGTNATGQMRVSGHWRTYTTPVGSSFVRAPDVPAFFDVTDATGAALFTGASHLADYRESAFADAETFDSGGTSATDVALQNSEEAFLTPLWLFAILGLMLWSWNVRTL